MAPSKVVFVTVTPASTPRLALPLQRIPPAGTFSRTGSNWFANGRNRSYHGLTMKLPLIAPLLLALAGFAAADHHKDKDGFIELFNGKDLTGWKINESPESWKVEDGELVAKGERSHLFYAGDVQDANFEDFEVKLKVLTKPKANAGFYFHTKFQDEGWPKKGFEAQINATHTDPKKTGSLYGVRNVMNDAPHKDNEWFDYHITVKDNKVTIKVNGETTVEYTQPEGGPTDEERGGFDRVLSSGTFAIQCHDPGSEVRFKSIKVKPL